MQIRFKYISQNIKFYLYCLFTEKNMLSKHFSEQGLESIMIKFLSQWILIFIIF